MTVYEVILNAARVPWDEPDAPWVQMSVGYFSTREAAETYVRENNNPHMCGKDESWSTWFKEIGDLEIKEHVLDTPENPWWRKKTWEYADSSDEEDAVSVYTTFTKDWRS